MIAGPRFLSVGTKVSSLCVLSSCNVLRRQYGKLNFLRDLLGTCVRRARENHVFKAGGKEIEGVKVDGTLSFLLKWVLVLDLK